jgi:hypothetical protein
VHFSPKGEAWVSVLVVLVVLVVIVFVVIIIPTTARDRGAP